MLVEPLCLWVVGTNAWVVAPSGAGGECVLVDAPPDPGAILARLSDLELHLVALLSTHGHVDHIGGVSTMARAQDHPVDVHIHDDDRHALLDPVGAGGALGRLLEQSGLDVRPPEVISGLDDGERVAGVGMTFTAVHTPGHTPGSTCFLLEVDGEAPLLFSGDHLFRDSIGRTDLPGGSLDDLVASMTDKILPLPDDVRVLPGHGPTTTVGRERRLNPWVAQMEAARHPRQRR